MCGTCGCSNDNAASIANLQNGERFPLQRELRGATGQQGREDGKGGKGGHEHHHGDHSHGHAHGDQARVHASAHGTTLQLEQAILQKNDELAERNRAWLAERNILALNLVSSPGSGKTTLLERTIRELKGRMSLSVIEGDQQTTNDAQRIKAAGAPSVQINTGTGCHLEADMVMRGLEQLRPATGSVLMIENVGNLVCPALFDLGEAAKVTILSVTEGDDKPGKYPHMFSASQLMILNKIDLLPHVDFDVDRCIGHARAINPAIEVLQLSARTGEGLAKWHDWLRRRHPASPHNSR